MGLDCSVLGVEHDDRARIEVFAGTQAMIKVWRGIAGVEQSRRLAARSVMA
jgi:hypothetical protein